MGGRLFTSIRGVFVCMAWFRAIGCGRSDHPFQLAEHDSPSLMLPCFWSVFIVSAHVCTCG